MYAIRSYYGLSPGLPQYPRLEDGTEQGLNDYLEYGWSGPCPPIGVHEYVFTLYALGEAIRPAGPTGRAVIVITSYSIHYTKLYENLPVKRYLRYSSTIWLPAPSPAASSPI